MLVIILIVGFILLIGGFWSEKILYSSLGGLFIGFAAMGMIKEKDPSAIDVYRGKTTLEITYKDGVPVDSVVVFKEK